MEMARDLTNENLQTREQFGRPIGKFQVLQHSMAEVLSDVEFSRSMVFWAASEVTNPDAPARRRAVSGAKAYVDHAARNIAERCVQMHGGVGVTDEYALTHYVKRLTLGQILFGDRDEHLLRYTGSTPNLFRHRFKVCLGSSKKELLLPEQVKHPQLVEVQIGGPCFASGKSDNALILQDGDGRCIITCRR